MRKRQQAYQPAGGEPVAPSETGADDHNPDASSSDAWRVTAARLLPELMTPDRDALRSELISLYHEYSTDASTARSLQEEYERMVEEAKDTRRAAQLHSDAIRKLLDIEFPEWRQD